MDQVIPRHDATSSEFEGLQRRDVLTEIDEATSHPVLERPAGGHPKLLKFVKLQKCFLQDFHYPSPDG